MCRKNLSELIESGFEGCDIDLETSLYEYGLIWTKKDDDYLFYYGIGYDLNKYEYNKFDYAYIPVNVRPKSEWDWVDWKNMFEFVGLSECEFFDREVPYIVSDLISYYGYEEIMGSSYDGFEVEN